MKTTFDLPDSLLRRAKAVAAHQGRPLRDLVAEALAEKLRQQPGHEVRDESRHKAETPAWKAFSAKLQRLPDGSWYNPDGVEDEEFFKRLDEIRAEGRNYRPRDPFADD